ncbi:hypothetical protein ACTD5D_41180 [Nocardia takedensis]|uniref:hypothetical protein n=1 Tax=Nocardia takedensis TaxID=259390 RepID=UPI003F769E49
MRAKTIFLGSAAFAVIVWPHIVIPAVGLVLMLAAGVWLVKGYAANRRWVR